MLPLPSNHIGLSDKLLFHSRITQKLKINREWFTNSAVKTVTHPIIGESGSKLGKRLSEHKSSTASSKSAVSEHVVLSGGHDIDWTGVKVLERESKEFSLRVLEAIQIKTKGPNLNRDKGLDLDCVLDTLLQKRDGAK